MIYWQAGLSDAVTSPHMCDGSFPAQFKPPVTSSITKLEASATALWCIPIWTAPENQSFDPEGQKMYFMGKEEGQKMYFTGKEATVLQRITEAMDVFASQQHLPLRSIWIVVETR